MSLHTTDSIEIHEDATIHAQQMSTFHKLYKVAGSAIDGTMDTLDVVLPASANVAGRTVNTLTKTIWSGLRGVIGR